MTYGGVKLVSSQCLCHVSSQYQCHMSMLVPHVSIFTQFNPNFYKIFNLVLIFINFIQFSLKFVPLQTKTKFNFYINVILKFLIKFTCLLNITFIIFKQTLTILLEYNY